MKSSLKQLINQVGEPQLFSILERFYARLATDVLVGFFFKGKDIKHIAKQQALFMLKSAGFSQEYSGKPPIRAHDAIAPILEGHFDRRIFLLKEHLKQEFLALFSTTLSTPETQELIDTWIEFETSFKKQIIQAE